MVMSMDTAAVDQAMGSPMEDSALSIRHQESADDELNMDEQSKASGQTVVDVDKNHQQLRQQQSSSQQQPHDQQSSTQHQEKSQQQQEGIEKQTETDSAAAMILSRESSFNDNDDDERKLMMNVDYEANAVNEQQLGTNEKIAMQNKFEDRADLDRKDSLVARMRDIVEGNQTSIAPCQHHQHHHHHHHHQPKSSSGDSLNNQATESNSKMSMDIAQQKRSRQARHCGRHHHHHHHHRPSLGTNSGGGGGQTVSSGHHHHHHHHHRSLGQQHAHTHRHHHHVHDHHQQQADSSGPQTSTAVAAGGKRSSSQRPLGGPNICQHQAAESSLSQADVSKQTGESKSSNSSVSSAVADQQQQQQEQEQPHDAIISSSGNPRQVNLDQKDVLERRMHHAPTCHYHTHQPGTTQHTPHHHHQHHHHHGRHHHHRNHKKRLVLDAGEDKTIEQVDSRLGATTQGDKGESTGNEQPEKQQESISVSDVSPTDPVRRAPLQEISSQGTNMTQDAIDSYCPYHEHHCASHQSRSALTKLHPHHCHHHHHQHADVHDQGAKKELTLGEQQQHRGHYHHHHHRHHHHGQHHSKARARRQKSSSKTNIDEQPQQKNSTDFEPSLVDSSNRDKQQEGGASADRDGKNTSADYNICGHRNLTGSKKIGGIDQYNGMHLDQNDEGQHRELTNQRSSVDKSSSEVVNMDISPNNEKKHIKMVGLAGDEVEKLIDSPATNSNFIAEIDISKQTKSNTNEQPSSKTNETNDHQQLVDSDFNAQGASGDATKQNSSHEFTRSQEGDSIKKACGKAEQLVRQMSMENSRKEMITGGAGSEPTKQQNHQQLIECSSIQQYQQSSQPKQIIESTASPDRRCRLCWCCCCPCSGNNTSKVEVKQNVTEAPSATANRCQSITPSVPLDRIRMWAESFDRLMKCPDGRRIFQDFLRCEYSEENILFWIACEELKNEKDPKVVATKARDIYEDYISILSAKEVSLDSRVRDIINNNIKKPTSNIFDEAQLQIYTLMHRDSYPRFINSPMYKKLAQIQTSSSRKGST